MLLAVQATDAEFVVTVTVCVPPEGAAFHVLGLTLILPGAACVTATGFPPIVAVAVRLAVLRDRSTCNVTVPLPMPVVGLRSSQNWSLVAAHCTVAGLTVTATFCVAPSAGALQVAALRDSVPAAWLTETVFAPIVTVAPRLLRLVVGAAVRLTLRDPVALLGLRVNQLRSELAAH